MIIGHQIVLKIRPHIVLNIKKRKLCIANQVILTNKIHSIILLLRCVTYFCWDVCPPDLYFTLQTTEPRADTVLVF